jgi:hypothetical protein
MRSGWTIEKLEDDWRDGGKMGRDLQEGELQRVGNEIDGFGERDGWDKFERFGKIQR